MSSSIECQFYKRLLIPHIQGTLAAKMPWLWIRLNAHLAECDSCNAELDQLMSTHLQLADRFAHQPELETTKSSVVTSVMRELELLEIAGNSQARKYRRAALA